VVHRLPEPRNGGLGINRLKRFARIQGDTTPAVFLDLLTRATAGTRAALYGTNLKALSHTWASERFATLHERGGNRRGLDAARYLDYKTFLPDDILALADRVGMAHGLELRVPFVDHELVEQAFPVPASALVHRRELKALLRRSQANRLPAAHFGAPKRGFVGPTAAWLRHDLRELLTDELSEDRVRQLGYFEPAAVSGLMREHLSGRQNHEGILWSLVCLSIWHRQLVERPAPYVSLGQPGDRVRGTQPQHSVEHAPQAGGATAL
jgi:asparagine synthase (glutamine-hydrolysing)